MCGIHWFYAHAVPRKQDFFCNEGTLLRRAGATVCMPDRAWKQRERSRNRHRPFLVQKPFPSMVRLQVFLINRLRICCKNENRFLRMLCRRDRPVPSPHRQWDRNRSYFPLLQTLFPLEFPFFPVASKGRLHICYKKKNVPLFPRRRRGMSQERSVFPCCFPYCFLLTNYLDKTKNQITNQKHKEQNCSKRHRNAGNLFESNRPMIAVVCFILQM